MGWFRRSSKGSESQTAEEGARDVKEWAQGVLNEEFVSRVNAVLAEKKAMYEYRDTDIALTLGLNDFLGLESMESGSKRALLAVARTGYAYRRVEELETEAERCEPTLQDLIAMAEEQEPELQHCNAMQMIARWIVRPTDGDLPMHPNGSTFDFESLPGAEGRQERLSLMSMAILADVLPGSEGTGLVDSAEEAMRFGYVLRWAEASLPEAPDRFLPD